MTNRSVNETGLKANHPAVRGTGVIFYIRQTNQFMFYLRDNKDSIPCPNMISLLGGHMEANETAKETALRELSEELDDIDTGQPFRPNHLTHFRTYIDDRGVEQNIFGCILEATPNLRLNEGQQLIFTTKDKLSSMAFAFGFSQVIQDFAQSL
jgi:8-oxo-dGTP diphosphatase